MPSLAARTGQASEHFINPEVQRQGGAATFLVHKDPVASPAAQEGEAAPQEPSLQDGRMGIFLGSRHAVTANHKFPDS